MDVPRLTPSMRIAVDDLELDHLSVIYPGVQPYALAKNVTVMPLSVLVENPAALLPT